MSGAPAGTGGPELHADCSRCFGLCCVLLPFSAVAGFGVDKAGGTPCHHLAGDDRCDIHATLLDDGWPGCVAFDCFGAGQQVSQVTYAGRSWRDTADGETPDRAEMAAVLSVMRVLHEMLTHLAEAVRRTAVRAGAAEHAEHVEVVDLHARVTALTGGTPEELLTLDLDDLLEQVGDRLRAVSALVRRPTGTPGPVGAELAGADLAGHDLRGRALRGADLRGALLMAADLRGVDLTDADLLGADLRDADARGARLEAALFLSQAQLNTLRGDTGTSHGAHLRTPTSWLRPLLRIEPR